MDRSESRRFEYSPPMRTVGPGAVEPVLRTGARKRTESGADAVDRRAVHAHAVLRLAADGSGVGRVGLPGQSQARATVDAGDGLGRRGAGTAHRQAATAAQGVPVPWRTEDCWRTPTAASPEVSLVPIAKLSGIVSAFLERFRFLKLRNIPGRKCMGRRPPRIAPARGPPAWEEEAEPLPLLDSLAQPEPDFQFDQTVSW